MSETPLQAEIERFGRLYVASSLVSHALVRSQSRQELLDRVVRVMVEVGKFAMAVVLWHDPATHELVPVARFGDALGYVDRMRVFADERPEGQGPCGVSFRTANPYICNDFLNDPLTPAWRDAARESGWRASANFPILDGGPPRGLLAVYAFELGAFGPDQVELLEQVARDLAFGLDHLDIVDRQRQAEAALAASERRLQLAMDAAALGSFDYDPGTGKIIRDERAERMFGFEPGGFAGTPEAFASRVHPEDLPRLDRDVQRARESHGIFSQEFRIVWPDGSEHWIQGRGGFLYTDSGEPGRMYGAVADVTERKRVEAALSESEERLRQAVRVAHIGIFDHNHVTGAIYRSPEQRDIYGWGPADGPGVEADIARAHPEDRERVAAAIDRSHDPAGDGLLEAEYRIVLPDGSIRWVSVRGQPFFDGEGAVRRPVRTVGATTDITAQKRAQAEKAKLEEQLFQAQKMESVGRLAGGVAHDFNNLLTVINGYSQLALTGLTTASPLWSSLDEIRKAGERAVGLTSQLLAFSRKQILQTRVLELNSVVRDMQPMLERLMGEDVDVRVVLAAPGSAVRADRHQLEQVIMNLAVNARDAMPGGGRLLIETAGVELDAGFARLHPGVNAGRYEMLVVSDSGTGMDEETRRRIFEPFFTTKPAGHGTGLGLAMVQGIVAQSGGQISVYSELGRGTAFKIYLPALEETAPEAQAPAKVAALGGTETVLVIEDMAEVRQYAVATLESYGYRVMEAENGGAALAICEREREPIHLVLSDVVMPGLRGPELASRLKKLRPESKVLLMSGYTDNALAGTGESNGCAGFIQKPFGPEQLAAKVREVLDAS
jgi:PAS domain S-box-containing protein